MHADEADFSSSLEKRLREMPVESRGVAPSTDEPALRDTKSGPSDLSDPSRESFSDAGDDDIAKALASRLESGTSTPAEASDKAAVPPEEDAYLAGV
jgi:hypothetical protein